MTLAPSGQGRVLILWIAVRGKFQYSPRHRDLSKDFTSLFFHSDKCSEQSHPVLPWALCLQMGFFLQPNRSLSSLPLGLTIMWPISQGTKTLASVNLSAYLGKNYYIVLSETLRFPLGNFPWRSPIAVVHGNKSPSYGKKHGGENKRIKAKRSRNDVIVGKNCPPSDQREEK